MSNRVTGLGFQTNPPAGSSLICSRLMYHTPVHGEGRVREGDHGQPLALEANALAGNRAEVRIDADAGIEFGAEGVGNEDRVPGRIEISIVGPRRQVGGSRADGFRAVQYASQSPA